MIREHNQEISELKCNLKNSIFEEDTTPLKKDQVWSFAMQPLTKLH